MDKPSADLNEIFLIETFTDGQIAILSRLDLGTKYLKSDEGKAGNCAFTGTKTNSVIHVDARFTIEKHNDKYFALKTSKGKYLSAIDNNDGVTLLQIRCDQTVVTSNELFEMVEYFDNVGCKLDGEFSFGNTKEYEKLTFFYGNYAHYNAKSKWLCARAPNALVENKDKELVSYILRMKDSRFRKLRLKAEVKYFSEELNPSQKGSDANSKLVSHLNTHINPQDRYIPASTGGPVN